MDIISGLMLGIAGNDTLPDDLKEFLSRDEQGIEGLEFMLKDPKLFKRIPNQVRLQYEILYGKLSSSIEKDLANAKKAIDEIISNPTPVIHQMIQMMYEAEKEE